MDTRIELERRGREPSKVTQLTLDNCRTVTTTGISEKLAAYTGLQTLSMINAGLTSLKGFPSLPSLKKLDISDNRLTGGLNHVAESCPKLEFLNLGGNRIKDLETLEPLKQLHELKHLDMYSCDITAVENYQDKIFQLLPQLNDLDGYDRDKKEVFEEDDEEEFGEEDDEEEDDDEGGDSDGENDVENGDSDSNDVTNGDDHDEEEEDEDGDDEVNERNDSDDEDILDGETVSATPIVDLNISNPEVEDEDEKLVENDEDEDDDDDDDEVEEDEEDEEDEEEEEEEEDSQSPQEEIVTETRGQKRTHSDDEDDDEEEEEEPV